MKIKYEKMKNDVSSSPLERLRAYVLSKGVRSLKEINMYILPRKFRYIVKLYRLFDYFWHYARRERL